MWIRVRIRVWITVRKRVRIRGKSNVETIVGVSYYSMAMRTSTKYHIPVTGQVRVSVDVFVGCACWVCLFCRLLSHDMSHKHVTTNHHNHVTAHVGPYRRIGVLALRPFPEPFAFGSLCPIPV